MTEPWRIAEIKVAKRHDFAPFVVAALSTIIVLAFVLWAVWP